MKKTTCLLLIACLLFFIQIAQAVPPHPGLLEKAAAGKKAMPYFIVNLDKMHEKGICTGDNPYEEVMAQAKEAAGYSPSITGTFNALAILVQFSDNASNTSATLFDSLLFDTNGVTVRDYYRTISYDQLDMVTVNMPSSVGWQTAPQTYAYYVDGQNGTGTYPNNSQKLVEDLVTMVDGSIDFSVYDNDNNGYVDVLIVMHAGQGAEVSGSNNDIWSHKWSISPKATNDGVYVSSYTIQPEYIHSAGDMTIGVIAHELGHGFGLPDLYDTDNSSFGIGSWGIMSFGSWLGPGYNGGRPAEPCAWSRIQMGFATPTNITSNTNAQIIQDVKSSGEIYRLWTSGSVSDEYFLVENRQKTGYDSYLPGSGLLIWHIDDAKNNNTQEWYPGMTNSQHFLVALEQADGLFEMEHSNDYGDGNDVFPGGLNALSFDASSSTTSDSYTGGTSFVAIQNITPSGGNIIADLLVGLSASIEDDNTDNNVLPTTIALEQNYPNPFNPSTTISFTTSVDGEASLEIYSITGQLVTTLYKDFVSAGTHELNWDATNDNGHEIASGLYLYKLVINESAVTKKMMLLR